MYGNNCKFIGVHLISIINICREATRRITWSRGQMLIFLSRVYGIGEQNKSFNTIEK
jgi:hypothetical protein